MCKRKPEQAARECEGLVCLGRLPSMLTSKTAAAGVSPSIKVRASSPWLWHGLCAAVHRHVSPCKATSPVRQVVLLGGQPCSEIRLLSAEHAGALPCYGQPHVWGRARRRGHTLSSGILPV